MIRPLGILGAGIAFVAPVLACATQPIAVDAAMAWVQPVIGIKYPPMLAGFDRTGVVEYDTAQRDVSAGYKDGASGTIATVYAFYAGFPDASIWHDRIRYAMTNGMLGTPDFTTGVTGTFTPPGESTPTGLRSSFRMSGKTVTASGVAIFAHDGWLVAVRMSSSRLDRDALDARMAALVAALPLAPARATPKPVYTIEQCAVPLPPVSAKLAEQSTADTTAMALSSLDLPVKPGRAAPVGNPRYCREPGATTNVGIYRLNGAADGYLVAMGDSGDTAIVANNLILDELHTGARHYSIRLARTAQTLIFPATIGLPAPTQVTNMIEQTRPLASVNRPVGAFEKPQINIFFAPDTPKAN
ncbi:hypothetical protein [Novosphingobium sp.]|uniref:hypothetical protein n=1 Tax=Novosphingobium sp. TaxID=1874826 RepID=UPI003D127DBA